MAKCIRCGKKGFGLKVNGQGLCPECVQADLETKLKEAQKQIEEKDASRRRLSDENQKLKEAITPEMKEASDLTAKIESLKIELASLDSQIKLKTADLDRISVDIIAAKDEVTMEQFALYRPQYNYTKSEDFKARLDIVRDQQKLMIRNGTAISASYDWTVNGSKSEGKKLIQNIVKLLLRSFNNECEAAVNEAKFNNFDRCQARIEKSYEAINKLGTVQNIQISPEYLKSKLDELHLAYEYEQKKQDEKDEQAEIRRQQREQAKLEKEIAEARKAAEKEKKHYEQALAQVNAALLSCNDPQQRAELEKKKGQVLDAYGEIEDKLKDIDYRQSNQKAGYVYIISNIGAFGENVYKIGMTRRLDPMERVDELGDASVPFYFDVHAMIFTPDAPALEAALHQAFESKRLNLVNRRREYFRVTLDEIKEVVKANYDKTVEFVDVAPAEQFRESRLMRENAHRLS